MKTSGRNLLLGTSTLAALVGLAVLLMLFGELDAFVKQRYDVTINTDHAAGLRKGSTIELNGVPVGVVADVIPSDDREFPVTITAQIDLPTRIPAGIVPYATASLLGGSSTLQLEGVPPPGDAADAYLETDGSARINHRIGIRLIEQIRAEFSTHFAPILKLAQNVNELLEEPSATDPEQARRNIRTVVGNVNDVLERFQVTLERVETSMTAVDETLAEYKTLAASVKADAARVTADLLPVLERLGAVLEETRTLANAAGHGEGTVAQLLNNPDLYRSMSDAMKSLDHALEELSLLVEQLRREGVQINL